MLPLSCWIRLAAGCPLWQLRLQRAFVRRPAFPETLALAAALARLRRSL